VLTEWAIRNFILVDYNKESSTEPNYFRRPHRDQFYPSHYYGKFGRGQRKKALRYITL